MNKLTTTVALDEDLEITFTEAGTGRPVLILHGGGGPFTVAGIADHLAETMHSNTSKTMTCTTSSSSAPPWEAGSAPRWRCATAPA